MQEAIWDILQLSLAFLFLAMAVNFLRKASR